LSTYLLHIGHIEVEGTRSVDDGLERRVRDDGLVKGILLGNVFYDGEVELVFAVTGVGLCDLVGFFLGPFFNRSSRTWAAMTGSC
jgi:hypothetical protein